MSRRPPVAVPATGRQAPPLAVDAHRLADTAAQALPPLSNRTLNSALRRLDPSFVQPRDQPVRRREGGSSGSVIRGRRRELGLAATSPVSLPDVLEILTPIWQVQAPTVRKVTGRIRSVLDRAIAIDLLNEDSCDRVLPVLGP